MCAILMRCRADRGLTNAVYLYFRFRTRADFKQPSCKSARRMLQYLGLYRRGWLLGCQGCGSVLRCHVVLRVAEEASFECRKRCAGA